MNDALKFNGILVARIQSKFRIAIFQACMLNCCLSVAMVSNQKCWALIDHNFNEQNHQNPLMAAGIEADAP